MKPINSGGHAAYQDHVLDLMRKYYPDPDAIPASAWTIIDRFWHLDLSLVDEQMADRYSIFGPAPRPPSCMLRSVMLSIEFKVTSFTEWSRQLKINPLYAIISGFSPGDTPGTGTFYDFYSRLWLSDSKNLSPHERQSMPKVKKPSKKGEKAQPVEKVTVDELVQKFQLQPPLEDPPFSRLFDIFRNNFLDVSAEKGLVDLSNLALSGDGTPVVTSARERSKRICDCREKGISDCDCKRYYSQPDCDVGWDSSRNCFYHGYDLYMLTASDSESDLPVFPLLSPASRHDSHGFCYTWFTMLDLMPDVKVSKILLDSAHDAMPLYRYFRRNSIVPFIDINHKRGRPVKYKDDFFLGDDGVPICLAGLKMKRDGCEVKKNRVKYRCPLTTRKNGCSCSTPCSDSPYGRTVKLQMKDDPRVINIPHRDSKEWKLEYNARTSSERCNKREKNDFLLESGSHRSSRDWYCRLYCIMMCQHLDAWDLPYESQLQTLLRIAA